MDNDRGERLASLETKMDYLIKGFEEMKQSMNVNFVSQKEYSVQVQELEKRITKVENAPHRFLTIILSVIGTTVAILALILK